MIRQPLLASRVRVRQWGRLPRRRGPTVLIANHQHEDESEIVVERAFVQSGLRPLFTASSRRMYEPGFFASRMPWLAPVMRGVNAGPLFRTLGMLPLENELAVRPLRTLARAVRDRHGDLPPAAVFRGDALAAVPAGARSLGDVLAPRHFAAGETRVRVSQLLEPYRGEAVAALRASVAEDVERIVGAVRGGATFFVTPEGFYSTDGRMRPLKGIVEHLTSVARVWLAAIAFDPFRGRRLSMLYRVTEPADPSRLGTSLAAARPVTTSALLARLLARRDPFTVRAACDAVARAREALPAHAFVDPELDRDMASCVAEAVGNLAARGMLVAEGPRYRAGSTCRTDARFPGVSDVVAYQAAFVDETIAALGALSR